MSVLCLRDSVSAYDLIRFLCSFLLFSPIYLTLPCLFYWLVFNTMLMPSRRRSVAGCVSDSVEGNTTTVPYLYLRDVEVGRQVGTRLVGYIYSQETVHLGYLSCKFDARLQVPTVHCTHTLLTPEA